MKLDGVRKAEVNWSKGEVVVEYDPRKAAPSQMVRAVNGSGVFKVKSIEDPSAERVFPRRGIKKPGVQ